MSIHVRVAVLNAASCLLASAPFGCADSTPQDRSTTGVEIAVAPLALPGLSNVCYDVRVTNGPNGTGETVWSRGVPGLNGGVSADVDAVCSDRFGNAGGGGIAYVGPCDASGQQDDDSAGERMNSVTIWLDGLYDDDGDYIDPGGTEGWQNPCAPPAGCTRDVLCEENADARVTFDLTVLRQANQGFFDIAVGFDDIFCSAKFDCCELDAAGTACADDLRLLFDASGSRAATMVLAFACTAGPGAEVETELYLDALELDCTSPDPADFDPDVVIDPSGAPGNQCSAGAVGGGECAALTSPSGADADTWLYQVGIYRGLEQLTSGGPSANKAYWNVTLGVKRPAIASCRLRARATADDALGTNLVADGTIAAGTVYPFVQWDVDLGTCKAERLSVGDGGMVRPEYTATTAAATSFAYGFGPGRPAGPFCSAPCVNGACVSGACECEPGFSGPTCETNDAACGALGQCPAGFTCNRTLDTCEDADEVWVPAGSFWMGCNPALDGDCMAISFFDNELPQNLVTTGAYAIDRTEVTAAAYKLCVEAGNCPLPAVTSGANSSYATYDPPDKQDHPINHVSWTNAKAYCAVQGKTLCSEAQWERAARGGCETLTGPCQTSMRKYPWDASDGSPSTAPTCTLANYNPSTPCEPGPGYTAPAGERPAGASPYGALDMAGNVFEYVDDCNVAYPYAPPTYTSTCSRPVARGGYFDTEAPSLRTSLRFYTSGGGSPQGYIGFRCCRAMP